ncbi:MAG: FMN-binding negative transcriptional regulator [Paracoccaceae bacterium]
MHPNQVFRGASDAKNIEFARHRGFGTLSVNADPFPLLSHIPFIVGDDGNSIDLHLVRSNPIARMLKSSEPAVISVMGPDSYISPDWYDQLDQVPTWNYVAVHFRGSLELLPDKDLDGVLDRLSLKFESRLQPKPAWTSAKMDQSVLKKLARAIVPFRLTIQDIQGTWKLGQNKTDTARSNAAHKVKTDGIGHEITALADLMQTPDK